MEKSSKKLVISQVIKQRMREEKLNLKKVSIEASIPYSTLYSWQENRSPKDIMKVKKLADYLGLSVDELLFGEKTLNESRPQKIFEAPLLGNIEIIINKK